MKCGEESRPEKAIGTDEDGEPACAFHQLKSLSAESDLPSPGRTAEEETAEMATCPGFEKECGKPLAAGNVCGLCTACYARRGYRLKHPKSNRRAKLRGAPAPTSSPMPSKAKTGEDVMRLHGFEAPVVTLRISMAQAEKLIGLLLE